MPDASDFTRIKRMIASANAYSPASPAMWVPRLPIVLPNMLHSNKFTFRIPAVETSSIGDWITGGDPFTELVASLSGGDPTTQDRVLYSGGFP